MFPLLEDYDLEERAGWIEQCDDLLATAIGGVRIADAGPEYSRSFDDWRCSKVLQEKASLLKEDDHANEMKKEAEALQQSDRTFVDDQSTHFAAVQVHAAKAEIDDSAQSFACEAAPPAILGEVVAEIGVAVVALPLEQADAADHSRSVTAQRRS